MEIEAKFAILSPRLFKNLLAAQHLLDHPLSKGRTSQTIDIYFDTASFQLLRHGFSLRLRQTENNWLVTLKSLSNEGRAAIHSRFEHEEALADDFNYEFNYESAKPLTIALLPATIQRLVGLAISSQNELRPLCRIVQQRSKRLLFAHDDENAPPNNVPPNNDTALSEVSIDHVAVYDGRKTDAVALSHFDELEIELLADNQEWLTEFARQFSKTDGLRADKQSKFERALRSVLTPSVIEPITPVAEFCRSIWLQQLLQMLLQEDGVRCNDAESVHQMRVAIRRMRAAAKLFAAQFRQKKIDAFLDRLRHTARLLGKVRDLDVAIERLQASVAADEQDDELIALLARWQKKRSTAHVRLLEWLNSAKYERFINDFLHFCQTLAAGVKELPARGEPPLPPFQLRHYLPLVLQERYATVRAFETLLLVTDDNVPLPTWHRLRIECKYLRYALEFSVPFLGTAGESLIEHLKQLQEALGDLNDAAVSAQMIKTSGHGKALSAYQQRQTEIIAEQLAQAKVQLADFVAPAQRRLLQQALARL